MKAKEICLLLDHTARSDLRQACERGYINRAHRKKRGVHLLELLGLIELTKQHKTMYRYEPTNSGRSVGEFPHWITLFIDIELSRRGLVHHI